MAINIFKFKNTSEYQEIIKFKEMSGCTELREY